MAAEEVRTAAMQGTEEFHRAVLQVIAEICPVNLFHELLTIWKLLPQLPAGALPVAVAAEVVTVVIRGIDGIDPALLRFIADRAILQITPEVRPMSLFRELSTIWKPLPQAGAKQPSRTVLQAPSVATNSM